MFTRDAMLQRGISYRHVSVCLCVSVTHASIVWKQIELIFGIQTSPSRAAYLQKLGYFSLAVCPKLRT